MVGVSIFSYREFFSVILAVYVSLGFFTVSQNIAQCKIGVYMSYLNGEVFTVVVQKGTINNSSGSVFPSQLEHKSDEKCVGWKATLRDVHVTLFYMTTLLFVGLRRDTDSVRDKINFSSMPCKPRC